MKTIDRYVLTKTLGPLFACIAIALIAMLLERMLRLLDFMLDKGGPFYLVLKMLANLIPHYLGLAIPAAFFVGMLLAVMRLSGDSELDAIHAMGVGLRRLLLPLVGLAVVLLVATAVIIGMLQPYTRYAYRALVYTATHTVWNSALERGTFFTGLGNVAIMVDDIADGGRTLTGIFLHRTEDDGSTTTISAEQGQLFRLKKDFSLDLQLIKGSWIRCDRKGEHCTVLNFDKSDVPLDMAQGPVHAVRPARRDREGIDPARAVERPARPAGEPDPRHDRGGIELAARAHRLAVVPAAAGGAARNRLAPGPPQRRRRGRPGDVDSLPQPASSSARAWSRPARCPRSSGCGCRPRSLPRSAPRPSI